MINLFPLSRMALPLALALAATPAAMAQETSGGEMAPAEAPAAVTSAAEAAPPAAPPVSAAGLVAARDPETGELRAPTAAELAELAAEWAPMRSDEDLVPVVRPDGTVTVDLQGRFLEFALATGGPEGAIVTRCTGDPSQALAILAGAPPATAAGDAGQPHPEEVRDDR